MEGGVPSAVKVVLATKNEGKLREFRMLLGDALDLVRLPDGTPLPEEIGQTYRENALLKAEAASRATGLPALADDSGLEVDALQGLPGVRSARFAGEGATDDENLDKVLALMADIPDGRRGAAFVATLCLKAPGSPPVFACGRVSGILTRERRGAHGFGYDPIFYHPPSGKTFAELDPSRKNALSHRWQAAANLKAVLGLGRSGTDEV